jgi:hypothetical protein
MTNRNGRRCMDAEAISLPSTWFADEKAYIVQQPLPTYPYRPSFKIPIRNYWRELSPWLARQLSFLTIIEPFHENPKAISSLFEHV